MVQHALAVFDCEDADKWHGHEQVRTHFIHVTFSPTHIAIPRNFCVNSLSCYMQLYISRFGGPGATWDAFKVRALIQAPLC